MADFFDPETKSLHRSCHSPDAIAAGWVNITGSAKTIQAIPQHYRVLDGSTVREATTTEKATIDAARLPAIKAARKAALAEEAKQRLALADTAYISAAANVDKAATVAAVEAVRLTNSKSAT